jgi:putative redox protein
MRTDLCVRAVHQNGMRVDVHVREHVLRMDYPAEAGRNPTPLEVLLASLAGCAASTLRVVLAKLGTLVDGLEVEVRAERRAEHPTVLTEIELVYQLTSGETLETHTVDRAVRVAEDQLCPVLNMLRPGTRIHSSWTSPAASVHG